ncbi:ABATE domain-containing protein [Streptomyces sp. TG1A-8]|uniref:CGNR zinc finger domain-containing protein n=1 Tax=Streptomyces sp. TG1A-8 TaxID=3051385 RepID=UPI00265BA713|nr:ABATE domain-containing protein [Streptomyces sp. TG1A-8]MDO0927482.1 ABATE domain-containing protein [Streptomyces sp. TG1A-8]
MALDAAATVPYGPRFDAGRICLELLATAHPAERLDSVGPLRAWITACGLVPPGTPLGHADASWPAAFRELRTIVDRLVRGTAEAGAPPHGPALGRLNEAARAAAPPAPCAVRGADGTLVRELAAPPTCGQLLAVVARDAVELLTDPVARAAVRQCEGGDCPLVYLDTSRGRRRRWCSSAVCGNRARVARHRRRAAVTRT